MPKQGSSAPRIVALADLLRQVWPEVTGLGDIPAGALEIALAQAGAEGTSYGQGWDGDMARSWNVGSYQCPKGATEGPTYRCVKHRDSRTNADGSSTEYITGFRFYVPAEGRSAAQNGARDYLTSITVRPFPALAQLQSGSVLDFAARIGTLGYYEGFNPESPMGGRITDWRSRWSTSLGYLADTYQGELRSRAERVKATPEQVAGRICLYARSMGKRLPEIVAALGHAEASAYVPEDVMA